MINTDLSRRQEWRAVKGFDNQFTLTFLQGGVAFDISTYTFTVNIRKIGDSANVVELTQSAGITNGGVTGIITILLDETASDIIAKGYFYEIIYSVGNFTNRLLQGTFNLVDDYNQDNTNTSLTLNVDLNGTDVRLNVTLGGSSGSAIQFQDEGVDLGNNQADTVDFVGAGVTATRLADKVTVTIPGGGSGTVTSVGDLSPLFTVTNPTTTPTFTAINQNANLAYIGPPTGAAAPPTFRALVRADLPFTGVPDGTKFLRDDLIWSAIPTAGHVIKNSGTSLTSRANLNFTNGLTASDNSPDTDVKLGGLLGSTGAGVITQLTLATPSSDENYFFVGEISNGAKFYIVRNSSSTGLFLGMAGAGAWGSATGLRVPLGTATYEFNDDRTTKIGLEYNAAIDGTDFTSQSLTHKAYVLGAKTYTGLQTFPDNLFRLTDNVDPTKIAVFELANIATATTRTYTLPDSNTTLIGTNEIVTVGGRKDFVSSTLTIIAPSSGFRFSFVSTNIAANRSMTIPLLIGNDTFVFQDFIQTLTNKTISGASNTITNVSLTTGVIGDLLFANLTQGSARSVLGVTGNVTADFASIQGTTDQVFRIDGAGTGLSFGSIDLSKAATVGSSVLPVANGGLNFSSYTIGDLIQASAAGVLSKLNSVATGNVLISGGVGTISSWGKVTSSHIDATVQTAGQSYLLASGGAASGTNTFAMGTNPFIMTSSVSTGTGATAGFQLVTNLLTTGNAFDQSSSSVTTGALQAIASTSTVVNHTLGTHSLSKVLSTGANSTASKFVVGISSIIQNTGTTNTNVASYFEATGASTNNIAIQAVGNIQTKGYTTTATYNLSLSKWPENTTQSIALVGNNLFINSAGSIVREDTSVSRGQAWVYYTGYSGLSGNALGYSVFNTGSSTLTHPLTMFQGGDTQLIAGGRFGWVTSTTDSRGTIASLIGHSAGTIQMVPTVGVFIGSASTATARLHIAAGTATASTAPIKLTSGTNLTTAEAGAFEYNGTNLFFTRVATRQTVLTANVVTTEVVVSDTTITVNVGGTDYKVLARA